MNENNNKKDQLEIEILQIERDLKQKELEKKSSLWQNINSTVVLSILGSALAALLVFGGNLFVEHFKYQSSLELQDRKDEAALIIETAKSLDPYVASKMLKFFIDTGIINNERIKSYVQELQKKGKRLFHPLFLFDPEGKIVFFAANSYEFSPDAKEIIITLSEEILIKSGNQVDSAYVQEMLEKYRNILVNYKHSEIIDKLKIKVYLTKPDPDFLRKLAEIGIYQRGIYQ